MTVSVCLSVCLSVRENISGTRLHVRSSPKFYACYQISVARFSGGVVVRYVLPVLWMTSYLHIMGNVQRGRCNTGRASQSASLV